MVRLRLGPDTDMRNCRGTGASVDGAKSLFRSSPRCIGSKRARSTWFSSCPLSLATVSSHPPFPDDASVPHDCFWSAFNFFNESPDNNAKTALLAGIDRELNKLAAPTQLGDLLILATRDSVPVHAAVFIADDIYFTKNGNGPYQPWI